AAPCSRRFTAANPPAAARPAAPGLDLPSRSGLLNASTAASSRSTTHRWAVPGYGLASQVTRTALREAGRYLVAEADCAGLPNTLRHSGLRLARCLRMHAMMRSRSGISEEQRRKTSGVHSRR